MDRQQRGEPGGGCSRSFASSLLIVACFTLSIALLIPILLQLLISARAPENGAAIPNTRFRGRQSVTRGPGGLFHQPEEVCKRTDNTVFWQCITATILSFFLLTCWIGLVEQLADTVGSATPPSASPHPSLNIPLDLSPVEWATALVAARLGDVEVSQLAVCYKAVALFGQAHDVEALRGLCNEEHQHALKRNGNIASHMFVQMAFGGSIPPPPNVEPVGTIISPVSGATLQFFEGVPLRAQRDPAANELPYMVWKTDRQELSVACVPSESHSVFRVLLEPGDHQLTAYASSSCFDGLPTETIVARTPSVTIRIQPPQDPSSIKIGLKSIFHWYSAPLTFGGFVTRFKAALGLREMYLPEEAMRMVIASDFPGAPQISQRLEAVLSISTSTEMEGMRRQPWRQPTQFSGTNGFSASETHHSGTNPAITRAEYAYQDDPPADSFLSAYDEELQEAATTSSPSLTTGVYSDDDIHDQMYTTGDGEVEDPAFGAAAAQDVDMPEADFIDEYEYRPSSRPSGRFRQNSGYPRNYRKYGYTSRRRRHRASSGSSRRGGRKPSRGNYARTGRRRGGRRGRR